MLSLFPDRLSNSSLFFCLSLSPLAFLPCLLHSKMQPAFSSPQHSTHNDFSDKENTIPHVNFSQASMKQNIVNNNTMFVESAFIPSAPGRVIFCKARGMNLDHVGNNAVLTFDTGFDFVHGAELKCSHAVCRRDGVKFRYCKHCDKGKFDCFFFEKRETNDSPSFQIDSGCET